MVIVKSGNHAIIFFLKNLWNRLIMLTIIFNCLNSDKYVLVDQDGETATTFTLQQIKIPGLLELFGVPNIAVSLALQRL